VSLGILNHVPTSGSISYEELARQAGVPITQLKSVVRMASTSGFLAEPQAGTVSHSAVSSLLAKDQSFLDWAVWLTEYSVPTALKTVEATKKWGETQAKDQTAFSLAMEKQLPFFDYLREEPGMAKMFSSYMHNVASTEGVSFTHLADGFDWKKLGPGSTIVDVGGSRGHASVSLAKVLDQPHFVVQDLPEALSGAEDALKLNEPDVASRIKYMQHSFFEPQPIKDADVYLLRMIIHDWPDADALKILIHLRDALKKPGARILIMDTVLPRPGTIPALEERKLRVRDLTMMQVFNAKEREREDWETLLRKAGLEIIDSRHPPGSVMSVLEVGVVQERPLVDGPVSRNGNVAPTNGGHDDHDTPVENSTVRNGEKNANGRHSDHDTPVDSSTVTNGVHTVPNIGKITLNGNHPEPTASSDNPVLIVGAGIGGLCLAQALKKSGIDFRVFERDPTLDYRPQGYRLKIEADGQQALKDSLPADVYKAFELSSAISNIGQTDFNPVSGHISKSRAGTGLAGGVGLAASATVDRSIFRKILMTGIEDKITFGKEVASYLISPLDEHVSLEFKDGSHVKGRFLVGADGVRSAVRKVMLPDAKYVDTGAMCIYGKTTITDDLLKEFPAKGLRWMTCCIDEAPSIQSILIGNSPLTLLAEPIQFPEKNRSQMELPFDYVYWVLIGRKELFVGSAEDAAKMASSAFTGAEAARLSLALTQEWHSSINSLMRLQDTSQCSTLQVVSAVPQIAQWEASRFVTLVSEDSAMSSRCICTDLSLSCYSSVTLFTRCRHAVALEPTLL
jgi:hypothetical protein